MIVMGEALHRGKRSITKIKLLSWNVNGVQTDEMEIYHLTKETKPDMIILTETRADINRTFNIIWPWAKKFHVLPLGWPVRAGTAITVNRELRP